MEEQIKRAVRNLNISYVFFWVLPAFLLGRLRNGDTVFINAWHYHRETAACVIVIP